MSNKIHDYVVNIKSFQMYLDNILVSIDDDRYHEPSIKKLSETITQYYSIVNGDYDEDVDDQIEIIESDNSDNSITSVKKNDSDSDSSNSDSDSDSDSDSSSSDSSSSDSEIDSLFLSSKKDKPKDKYLDEFINQSVDNTNIKLYQMKPEYQYNLENFLTTSQNY